jgi:hypothetical protein
MTGILPETPNPAPPELRQDGKPPWLALGVAFWDKLKAQKPKRPGRPRMTIPMIVKTALAWVKMPKGTPRSRAIEQVADEHYPDSDSAVENVRRQLAREAKQLRREKMRERGGILGK